jgi:hypothetical protein
MKGMTAVKNHAKNAVAMMNGTTEFAWIAVMSKTLAKQSIEQWTMGRTDNMLENILFYGIMAVVSVGGVASLVSAIIENAE